MKLPIAFVLSLLVQHGLWAAPLKAQKVQAELGASLGFHIYRFEVKLGADEVLLVREVTEDQGKLSELESALVGSDVRVDYEIVLVDSGAFHPSLGNTYMLRIPTSYGYLEKLRLSRQSQNEDGSVEFEFSGIADNVVVRRLKWLGSVEKYSEVVKRWPDLPKPRANSWSGSRRIIK